MLDRTILHDFESAFCYWGFGYFILSHLGAFLRTIFGPMPEFYCWWIIFGRNVIGNGLQLCLDCNMVFRVRILCNLYILLFDNQYKLRVLNDFLYNISSTYICLFWKIMPQSMRNFGQYIWICPFSCIQFLLVISIW